MPAEHTRQGGRASFAGCYTRFFNNHERRHAFLPFVIVVIMASSVLSQTLPGPQAVTDPKQISSKPNAQVEKNLTIEKLYMTRAIGETTWSPDGKKIAYLRRRNEAGQSANQIFVVFLAK